MYLHKAEKEKEMTGSDSSLSISFNDVSYI